MKAKPKQMDYSNAAFAARWIIKEVKAGKLDEIELAKFLKLFKVSPDG